MAFPSTSLLDNFNRANGGLGSNWTSPISAQTSPSISSNVVIAGSSVYGSAYWNPSTVGPTSEVYVTIPAGASSQSDTWLFTRLQNANTGSQHCYIVNFQPSTSSAFLSYDYNNANSGAIYTVTSLPIAAGWKIGMRTYSIGNDVKTEIWADSGSGWLLRGTGTHSAVNVSQPNLLNAGYIAFAVFGNNATTRSIDDFSGGTGVIDQHLVPTSTITTNQWRTEVGTTDLHSSIDESVINDADYIISGTSPASADISEVKFSAGNDPVSSTGHIVRYRYKKDLPGGDQIDLVVRLVQGTTIIKTWTHTNISDTLTTAEQTLSGAEADSITDYTDLRLRFEADKP